MKISELNLSIEPENVTIQLAEFVVGNAGLFQKMRDARWVKPVVQEKKCTLFSLSEVRVACARLRNGELPAINSKDECQDQSEKGVHNASARS